MTAPNPGAPATPPPAPATQPAPPAPQPPAQPPAAPPAQPTAPAAPVYVPPAQLTPPPAPTGPTYQPVVPLPQAPPPDDDGTKDWSKLPQWAQQEAARLKDENAKRRIEARAAVVTQHAQFAAIQLGVNPAALLGSVAYQQLASQLDPHAADFASKLTAAIQQTLAANPWMAAAPTAAPAPGAPSTPGAPAAPPPPPASGVEFPGGNPATTPITEAQLAQMTPDEITKAFNEGRLKHLL